MSDDGAPSDSDVTAAARLTYLDVCLLRAADVKPRATWVRPSQRRRVVFLHGWLQDHHSWRRTAQLVRRSYGHDCLLLDWPCHGLSETPLHAVMGPELCLAALRATLERVGWTDGSVPLTLAGCSYGGAMAMRYTSRWPGEVDRLVLVGTAGFDEALPTLVLRAGIAAARAVAAAVPPPPHSVADVAHVSMAGASVVDASVANASEADASVANASEADASGAGACRPRRMPPLRWLCHWMLQQARLVRTTPRYNNTPDWFNSAAAQRPMLVVCARYDALPHRTTTAAAAAAFTCHFHLPLSLATTCDYYHQLPPITATTTAPTAPTAPPAPTAPTYYQVRRAAPRPPLGGRARQRRHFPHAHAAPHPPAAVLCARVATAGPGAPYLITYLREASHCLRARLLTNCPTNVLTYLLAYFACCTACCRLTTYTYLLTHFPAGPGPARMARR